MVQVEDISFVPKVLQCSYKAISDNKYRYYNVSLFPASQCLPVSQCTENNYRRYEDEGGDGGSVEEAWSNGSAARLRGVAGDVERKEKEDEAATMAVDEPEWRILSLQLHVQTHLQCMEGFVEGQHASNQVHELEISLSESERERRKKGKELLHVEAHGLQQAAKLLRPNLENLGSNSCEPGAQHWIRLEPMFSDDADSKAGPVIGPVTGPTTNMVENENSNLAQRGADLNE